MRRPHRPRRSAWRRWEEPLTVATVLAGLFLLFLSFRSFHGRAARRAEALKQLRSAAQQGAAAGSLDLGRRGSLIEIDGSSVDAGREAVLRAISEATDEDDDGDHLPQGQHEGGQLGGGGDGGDARAAAAAGGGAAADELQAYCDANFGLEWVRRWGAAARQVCTAAPQLPATGGGGGGDDAAAASTVTCRSIVDPHLPAASAPHVLCDATNLRLDPSKLVRARCPLHRPGYMCTTRTYHRYERGAWSARCSWPQFELSAFSKDHQQDIFDSMLFEPEASAAAAAAAAAAGAASGGGDGDGAGAAGAAAAEQEEALPTLLVTREIREHANVFHTLTDVLNVYITLRVLGWEGQPRQVLMLDAHPPGPLDILWPVVAAGGGPAALAAVRQAQASASASASGGTGGAATAAHPWDVRLPEAGGGGGGRLLVRRAADLQAALRFRHAAFVPPGYASLLFAHLHEPSSCPLPTALFAGFRRFLLESFGLGGDGPQPAAAAAAGAAAAAAADTDGGGGGSSGGDAPLTVFLVVRRPAPHRRMARQIGNEAALLEALQALDAGLSVSLLDLAGRSVEEQLALVQRADVLIGMHGAALAYSLLLRPHAALVELWPQADGIWRCYENMAQWGGALYRRVACADPARHRTTPTGDVTEVDAAELAATVAELAPLVRARRAAAAAAAAASADGGAQELR